jgi:putative transcriptional regulator
MCVHDENGALGIVANRPVPGLSVASLMGQLEIDPGHTPERSVMNGGPVEPQRGFVLHTPDYEGQGTIMVGKAAGVGSAWGLTSTLDVLRAIAEGRGPRHWLAALGYTGWGPGQLEDELGRHGWQTAPGNPALLFETPVESRWAAAFATLGINANLLAAEAGHA